MEEFFTVVGPIDYKDPQSEIVVQGCVTRNLAHSSAKVPHASVLILSVRRGTRNVFIHQRSKIVRICPEAWDTFGGHISFEMALLSSPNALAEASLTTAVREAREEILVSVDGKPYLIQHRDFRQIGRVGQFTCAEPTNVEYATAFILYLPEEVEVGESPFERRDGTVEWLPVQEVPWDTLLDRYRTRKPGDFADGVSRLLDHALISNEIRDTIDQGPPRP